MINYVLILGAVGTCIALFALARKLFPDCFDLVMLAATGPIVLTSVYFDWVTWSWLRAFGVIFGTWATLISVVSLGLMAKDKIKAEPKMEPNASRPRRPAAAADTTGFDVVLESFGNRKIGVIKVVRAATGLGLKEVKDLVEGVPKKVKEGISKKEAAKLKAELEEAGATVFVKGYKSKRRRPDDCVPAAQPAIGHVAGQKSTQHMSPSYQSIASRIALLRQKFTEHMGSSCQKQSSSTMTLCEAEHILDVLSEALVEDDGLPYHPRSSLQGYDVFEIDTAIKLRIANDFLLFTVMGDLNGEFAQRVNAWESTPITVASLFVPDAERDKLRKLPRDSREFKDAQIFMSPCLTLIDESGFKDPRFASLETLSSFAAYCKYLGASNPIYWQKIYTRLGLAYAALAPNGNDPNWEFVQLGDDVCHESIPG